jgi:hypothetical protein
MNLRKNESKEKADLLEVNRWIRMWYNWSATVQSNLRQINSHKITKTAIQRILQYSIFHNTVNWHPSHVNGG